MPDELLYNSSEVSLIVDLSMANLVPRTDSMVGLGHGMQYAVASLRSRGLPATAPVMREIRVGGLNYRGVLAGCMLLHSATRTR